MLIWSPSEHAGLANDLLAYAEDKIPDTDQENIFTVLRNQCQLTYSQARISLEHKMKERERDFVAAGLAVYNDPILGSNPEVRRWIACLPYGMGGYLAWSQEVCILLCTVIPRDSCSRTLPDNAI